jgi:hypothetical protein
LARRLNASSMLCNPGAQFLDDVINHLHRIPILDE